MIYILYSNDYEVYLGGNFYQEKKVLIETTERVLSTCETIGIPMTLFCDLLCLWRYRELGYTQFPDLVDLQLKRSIKTGHDIQMHIHPHWLRTEIIYGPNGSCKYNFDLSKFLLGNWISEGGAALQKFCYDVFLLAKQYLENLLSPLNPQYRCLAFRAGGYGIQPYTKEIFQALRDAGFLIDSSVVPGMVSFTNVNKIDFSDVPNKGNYFLFSDLTQDSEKGIFEIPILALRPGEGNWLMLKSFIQRSLTRFLLKKKKQARLGYSIQSTDETPGSGFLKQIQREIKAIHRGSFMLELISDSRVMFDATQYYINRYYDGEKDLYFSLSCHSKSITSESLEALKNFHRRLEKKYGSQIKAITFQEASRLINLTTPATH